MRSALYILTIGLLSACSSPNYIGIETYNPAEITFPEKVGKVLIVNNAVPQPNDIGYKYRLMGKLQDTARVSTDSALLDACQLLGKAIVNVSHFDDVLLYDEPVREDRLYYVDVKLTPPKVEALCKETGTDAVISFDRLLFDMDRDIIAFSDGFLMGDIRVKILGVLRTYLPGRENPLATVLLNDSVFWTETRGNMVALNYMLPSPEESLHEAAKYIGEKAAPNFVPHWNKETRWYYGGLSTAWKEATAYAKRDKWDEAAECWKRIYDHSSGKGKGKAAGNLALYYEMKTRLKESLDWADKSYNEFMKSSGESSRESKMMHLYIGTLKERILTDKKLNMQFGEE